MKDRNPTLILRMTNKCNLNCKYCYDKENHNSLEDENKEIIDNMDIIVENIVKVLSNPYTINNIIFHGGEPLIIKGEIYEKLILKILEYRPNTKFSIQTNGTLLNEEHIKIFKKYNVHIGISLDGYNENTNENRIFKNGINSFNSIMKNIEKLRKNKMNYGIIMGISKQLLGNEEEVYKFIYNNDLKCNIRPIFLNCGDNSIVITNKEYAQFFENLFEIWIKDEKVKLKQITEIYEEFYKCLNEEFVVKRCSCIENCFIKFICMDLNGNLYVCNRNYNIKNFYYGNIKNVTIEEVIRQMREFMFKRKEYIYKSKCNKCELFKECYGGCPSNAYIQHGTIFSCDDYFCQAKLEIRHYIKKRLLEMGLLREYKDGLEKKKKA